ncbi:hypothetical protein Z959_02650 [Clostridium novyi B str. ATCC 27606]|uniref:Uncharacterized protein n=1 Tax=Clostridium novyi B str. ATCC 27606 TaxID=1443123 RepID=A0AA40M586_CLONO|nr:hypothetical protein [Clostridium novyi]KEI13572.1 hypothetical protein Z959_02650 [Clostridium novyi B str. ATCC 27606]
MNLYKLLKDLIEANYYEKEDMLNKLNVFYAFNQISAEQYKELMAKVNQEAKEEKEITATEHDEHTV